MDSSPNSTKAKRFIPSGQGLHILHLQPARRKLEAGVLRGGPKSPGPPPTNQSERQPPFPLRQPRAKIPNGTARRYPPSPSAETREPELCKETKAAFSRHGPLRASVLWVRVLLHLVRSPSLHRPGGEFGARRGRGRRGRDRRRRDPRRARCRRGHRASGARIQSAEEPGRPLPAARTPPPAARTHRPPPTPGPGPREDGGPPQQSGAARPLRRFGHELPGPVQRVPQLGTHRPEAAALGPRR